MNDETRKKIEEKFADWTPEDWASLRKELRTELSRDKDLQAELRIIDASQATLPSYISGYRLRLPT